MTYDPNNYIMGKGLVGDSKENRKYNFKYLVDFIMNSSIILTYSDNIIDTNFSFLPISHDKFLQVIYLLQNGYSFKIFSNLPDFESPIFDFYEENYNNKLIMFYDSLKGVSYNPPIGQVLKPDQFFIGILDSCLFKGKCIVNLNPIFILKVISSLDSEIHNNFYSIVEKISLNKNKQDIIDFIIFEFYNYYGDEFPFHYRLFTCYGNEHENLFLSEFENKIDLLYHKNNFNLPEILY